MKLGSKALWAALAVTAITMVSIASASDDDRAAASTDKERKRKAERIVVNSGNGGPSEVWISGDGDDESSGGYLGVNVHEETEAPDGGARVVGVVPDSPAAKAGLEKGDVIVGIDGKSIHGPVKLTETIRKSEPGDKVALEVLRDGKRRSLSAELGKRPRTIHFFGEGDAWGPEAERALEESLRALENNKKAISKKAAEDAQRAIEESLRELRERSPELKDHFKNFQWKTGPGGYAYGFAFNSRPVLGVELVETTEELRTHLGGSEDAGVLVGRVIPGSAAEKAGVKVGDLITEVEGERIEDASDLREQLDDRAGKTIDLKVVRDGKTMTLKPNLPEKDPDESDTPRPRALLRTPEPAQAPMAPPMRIRSIHRIRTMPPTPEAAPMPPEPPEAPAPPAVISIPDIV